VAGWGEGSGEGCGRTEAPWAYCMADEACCCMERAGERSQAHLGGGEGGGDGGGLQCEMPGQQLGLRLLGRQGRQWAFMDKAALRLGGGTGLPDLGGLRGGLGGGLRGGLGGGLGGGLQASNSNDESIMTSSGTSGNCRQAQPGRQQAAVCA
jgi:hypothetical protein